MQRTGLGTTLLLVPESARGLLSEEHVERQPLQTIPAALTVVQLTAREKVVLRALADSGTAADAARALVVSVNTIKAQSRSIYRKLGVTSLQSAIAVAELHGVLPRN
jgi:LuxR family maltose regulon positive regulatory protein